MNHDFKNSRFPKSLFLTFLLVLNLMSGVHSGIVVLLAELNIPDWIQPAIPMVYWELIALGLTLFTKAQITRVYDGPMQQMAEATKKVAQGDFSVYISPLHTADKQDYLDRMILDFNKMVEDLGGLETMRTDFISNVSHEIKTPLSTISNYAQLLQEGTATPEQQREYFNKISEATRRLSALVSNILKLNKLENQTIQPNAKPYDLCAQLAECAILFEDAWERQEIEVEFDIEDRATIVADKEMMELVWNNLLSNALKFTPKGGAVTVCQSSDADSITVSVTDTGCGMSQETMGRIFEKFYQGDTSHSSAGNGLGLALVQRVLQFFDGTVTVESVLGQGSTFTVRLPTGGAIRQ